MPNDFRPLTPSEAHRLSLLRRAAHALTEARAELAAAQTDDERGSAASLVTLFEKSHKPDELAALESLAMRAAFELNHYGNARRWVVVDLGPEAA